MEKVTFTVEGRKVPLKEIREKMLSEHTHYMRDHPDTYYNNLTRQQITARLEELHEYNSDRETMTNEQLKEELKRLERSRHLMMWHDNSTVANHGYLACLTATLYDPAVFLTNAEYEAKTGKTVCVQTMVEKPKVYFIARCSSAEAEQIAYSDTRLSCIQETAQKLKTNNGTEIKDIPRLFKADSPGRQFENGTQKGGNYFCECGCHAARTDEIDHALSCPLISFEERIKAFLKHGSVTRVNTLLHKVKPLKDLSPEQLQRELAARGIYNGKIKQELKNLLDMEMHGMQRVPALLINNPKKPLKELCLDRYEVLPVEPLHDVGHHIDNILTELPHHLEKKKEKLQETISASYAGKESKRGVDHREALIKVTCFASQKAIISGKELSLLRTLIEIQRILYSPDEKRNVQQILRYYNQSWYHAVLLKQIIKQPKKLTRRKLFGVYYHDLTTHAGLMLRLVSGQSASAEEEERIFNHIKGITKQTSNYSHTQIIPNIFLRLQAETEMKEGESVQQQQHRISHLAESLPPNENTCIPLALIKKYPRQWQAHLMQISDFLMEGEGVWWSKDEEAVEFHDVSNHPSSSNVGPKLHHFRSSSFPDDLKQCWEKCLQNTDTIPTNIIRVDQEDGKTKVIHTSNLGDTHIPSTIAIVPQKSTSLFHNAYPGTVMNGQVAEDPNVRNDVSDEEDEGPDLQLAEDETVDLDNDAHCPEPPASLNSTSTGSTSSDTSTPQHHPDQSSTTTDPTHLHFEGELQRENAQQKSSSLENKLQTSLGKALEIVLGQTTTVHKIDQKHLQLKELKEKGLANKQVEEAYINLLAPIQVQVLAEKSKTEKDLQAWEREYYVKNNLNSPSYELMKQHKEASVLLKKIKYASALLKKWDISF